MSEINSIKNISDFWEELKSSLEAKTVLVKPRSDGCSTGVVHLYKADDLKHYFSFIKSEAEFIPAGTITNQDKIIELPKGKIDEILFEKFIETDITSAAGNKIKYLRKSGFIEVTIGFLEEKNRMHAFNPSITISEGEVLSLEEKFQGGTGINLTPPPQKIVKLKAIRRAKELAEQLAEKVGLQGYARIDSFMNVSTGELVIIEVNTLPGLTPSTVFFHQGLAENPKIFPLALLEKIIQSAGY
jgi:D-alanine-D-alanine ligase-like ATP-grasp enzyme